MTREQKIQFLNNFLKRQGHKLERLLRSKQSSDNQEAIIIIKNNINEVIKERDELKKKVHEN